MGRFGGLLSVCILAACGQGGGDYVDGVIVFDNSIDYPVLDLRFSDVAEVTYVPLKGVDEGYLLGSMYQYGNEISIDEDDIYIRQENGGIYVFDRLGNPLRKLDRRGRGLGEWGQGNFNFWVEPESNSVYVQGMLGVFEYDDAASFDFKRGGSPEFMSSVPRIAPLNRDYVILHYRHESRNAPNPIPFSLMSTSDWEMEPLPVRLERPYMPDPDWVMRNSTMVQGREGVFLCSMRSDTISWISRETMEVSPRMVDKSKYPRQELYGHEIMALPSFETERYLFFSIVFWPPYYPNMERRGFVFDKGREKIFSLPQTEEWRYFPAQDPRLYDLGLHEHWLTVWNTTLNRDYGAVLFQAIHLIDNMDILPPGLKEIAATLEEGNNPVLAVIRLK
ncbi:MAG: 6-bladed beta-propeller [Alistipes sp.]|jgi:hypothetical protein|nr:6-bladed beta-propeller [Alistipes sp.]